MMLLGSTLLIQSLHLTSVHFTSVHFTSLQFTSVHFSSLQFTSLHFSSLHLTSLHITSVHFSSVQFSSVQFNPCRPSCSMSPIASYPVEHFILSQMASVMWGGSGGSGATSSGMSAFMKSVNEQRRAKTTRRASSAGLFLVFSTMLYLVSS